MICPGETLSNPADVKLMTECSCGSYLGLSAYSAGLWQTRKHDLEAQALPPPRSAMPKA